MCENPVEARLLKRMHDRVCVCVRAWTGRAAGHYALLTGELLRHLVRSHRGEQVAPLYLESREQPPGPSPDTVTTVNTHVSLLVSVGFCLWKHVSFGGL